MYFVHEEDKASTSLDSRLAFIPVRPVDVLTDALPRRNGTVYFEHIIPPNNLGFRVAIPFHIMQQGAEGETKC
jgi:hypothetical protein